MNGKLYIVSTPIGNHEDITLRALNILKSVDLIICEEYREGRRLLANYKIEKDLIELNEHNEKEAVDDILIHIINGKNTRDRNNLNFLTYQNIYKQMSGIGE